MSPVSGPARSAPARDEIGEIPHTIRFADADGDAVGAAVTPNVAEVLMCALLECLTGIDLARGDVDRGLRGQFHTAWALAA